MDFYVNLMRANQLAKVHKAECAHCRHGRGHPRQGHRLKNETWSGPFPTREVAFARATRSGLRRADGWGHCKP